MLVGCFGGLPAFFMPEQFGVVMFSQEYAELTSVRFRVVVSSQKCAELASVRFRVVVSSQKYAELSSARFQVGCRSAPLWAAGLLLDFGQSCRLECLFGFINRMPKEPKARSLHL